MVREKDGKWGIYDLHPAQPWETSGQERMPIEELAEGEVTVTFFAHACVEIKLGDKTLVTDPWLLGPAFLRGWWLSHVPPEVREGVESRVIGLITIYGHIGSLSPMCLPR